MSYRYNPGERGGSLTPLSSRTKATDDLAPAGHFAGATLMAALAGRLLGRRSANRGGGK